MAEKAEVLSEGASDVGARGTSLCDSPLTILALSSLNIGNLL